MVLFHDLVQLVRQLDDLLLLGGHEAVLLHEHLLHAVNLVLLFSHVTSQLFVLQDFACEVLL